VSVITPQFRREIRLLRVIGLSMRELRRANRSVQMLALQYTRRI
jgi:hypothetical protein